VCPSTTSFRSLHRHGGTGPAARRDGDRRRAHRAWLPGARRPSGQAGVMITLVLVDDSAVVRTGLRALATHDGDIEVVAEAGTGRAGLAEVRRTRPDVVLMDLRMPELDGIEATRAIAADPELAEVRVVILTTFDEETEILAAIRAGAAGYLLKDVSPGKLRESVRAVAAGEPIFSPTAARTLVRSAAAHAASLVDTTPLAGLSDREREVLTAVGRG